MNIPTKTRDKGQQIVDDGKVSRVKGLAFIVIGSTGTPYSVWLSYPEEASGRCECPSRAEVCPHLFAASVFHLANPEEATEKPVQDPFRGLGMW